MANGKIHTVQRGETIVQIAHRNKFRAWEPIWEHEQNTELRQKRPNPHLLAKGDQLFIPEKTLKDNSCQTNMKHTFKVRSMTQHLEQVLLDENEQPLAQKSYELRAGGKVIKDKTDAEGLVKAEIPIAAKTAELKVWLKDGDESSALTWTLELGHLEPVDTTYGLKSHLKNLGYDCGPVNDQFDDKTKSALLDFQREHDLPQTGQNDAATQNQLRKIHEYGQ